MWRPLFLKELIHNPSEAPFVVNFGITRNDIVSLAHVIRERFKNEFKLQKSQRIVVQACKHWILISLYVACVLGEWIFVPISAKHRAFRYTQVIADLRPALIIFLDDLVDFKVDHCCKIILNHKELTTVAVAKNAITNLVRQEIASVCSVSEIGRDVAKECTILFYTSGTTGLPKAAMVTYKMLAVNLINLRELWKISASDILLHTLPLNHVHGLALGVILILMSGAQLYWLDSYRHPCFSEAWTRSTMFMSVPEVYKHLVTVQLTRKNDCQMRLCICGSGPLRPEVAENFHCVHGYQILQRYGMSECGMITSDDPSEDSRTRGSVGRPLKDRHVTINDPNEETGIGEVLVQSSSIFAGYWNSAAKTEAAFTADGAFRTGDLGKLEDGLLFLCGRMDDMFIIGGENFYPAEIEENVLKELAMERGWKEYCCSRIAYNGGTEILEFCLCCLYVPAPSNNSITNNLFPTETEIETFNLQIPHEQSRWIAELRKIWEPRLIPRIFIPCTRLARNEMGKLQRKIIIRKLENESINLIQTRYPNEKKLEI
eukprot:Gregarina_sp_Poly_1__8560@NODE_507_length_7855_cov_144_722779_g405_i0_p2_GENE_NODE_507_length_7855_cov_144_722779_g405_i0NODE_507_length_7855_cov_144_722779_g405_i0_p2_ORF_typecomplete_len545_score61_74AMPbinding/PF00501_28/2_1e69_NODE_507_length_7855_cov_144_722779_g405_i017493383